MEKVYKKYSALFLVPILICFLISFVIPFVYGIVLSFFSWRSSIKKGVHFVGMQNYVDAFKDEGFIYAMILTFIFTAIAIVTVNLFAFIIAMLLTRGKRFTNGFRTIFFMPNLIGGIVLGKVWQVMINALINKFIDPNQFIESNRIYGIVGLIFLINWQLIGYMSIIYIAGIQNVPTDLLDAAEVDGASFFQKVRKIIIPSVMPSVTICLFLTLSNSFKLFDQNLSLSNGQPLNSSTGIYESGLLAFNIVGDLSDMGKVQSIGQAKAVIFFLLIGAIALLQVFLTRRKEVEA